MADEAVPYRSQHCLARSDQSPTYHDQLRVEDAGKVSESKSDEESKLLEKGSGFAIMRGGGLDHVLAPNVIGIAPRNLLHERGPTFERGLTSQPS